MSGPRRITATEWHGRMADVPEEFRRECVFLRGLVPGGVPYLESPHDYACKGDFLLSRLKFDDSPEALRLWSFIFSEKDRLFLAKEKGWKVLAAMKDLGQVPLMTYALPGTLTFYADELWWAPCFAEETRLLDEAAKLGATEDLCYVRAALGAMKTLDYFPEPDLCIAAVGGVCDDFSAVMQLIEWQGNPVHWWEIPARLEESGLLRNVEFRTSPSGSRYQADAVPFLVGQYRGIIEAVEEITGTRITPEMLRENIVRFNEIRGLVRSLREKVYSAEKVPLPGLEMYLAEFIAPHACSEPEESVNVLRGLHELADRRITAGESPLDDDAVRVYWVTPPTDASLVTELEDMGGCVAGTEYIISHSYLPLDDSKDPLEAIAENQMDDPMVGASEFRARRIASEAERFGAEGVLITGIFGASHCPFESRVIEEEVRSKLNIPVLSFDVPYSPGRPSEQVLNRLEAFVNLLRMRR